MEQLQVRARNVMFQFYWLSEFYDCVLGCIYLRARDSVLNRRTKNLCLPGTYVLVGDRETNIEKLHIVLFYDPICIKVKNRQNWSVVLEVRLVLASGMQYLGGKKGTLEHWHHLVSWWGQQLQGVFILWKFIELFYTPKFCTLFCVMVTFQWNVYQK